VQLQPKCNAQSGRDFAAGRIQNVAEYQKLGCYRRHEHGHFDKVINAQSYRLSDPYLELEATFCRPVHDDPPRFFSG